MALFVQIGLLSLLLIGCSNHTEPSIKSSKLGETSEIKKAEQEIQAFKDSYKTSAVPAMILPPVYQEISVFDDQKITFSAQRANFESVMYSISNLSGLNLIIDKDVDKNIPITISVKDASLEDALDVIMDISGCFYVLKGNILHVKQFAQKSFMIPYIHSTTSFTTDLGGDMLSSASSGGSSGGGGSSSAGVKGEFKLKYNNPLETNDFYGQLEKNLASLISVDGKYTLNRFNGILNVYDKIANLNAIESMIKRIKKQSNKQVLIEAKILEVVLNENHQLGINWESVAYSISSSADKLLLQQTLGLNGAVAGTISYNTKYFSTIISALDESGNVETLSNPSVNVLSGQSAVISSGKLVPFWEKEVQTTQGTGGSASTSEVTYNRRDVLHGVTMGVTPTIMEDDQIMLNIIPITSSIEDTIDYTDEDGKSVASAPLLNIKEIGTVVFAKDNSLVLIGGLINNTISKKEDKIPWLGDIPWLGGLFKRTIAKDEKRELVILLRLKIKGNE